MARQLEARLEELQLERARLQETVRRVGESLGKGLDRDALLGIVVQTAVDGVGAECGRVVMRDGAERRRSPRPRAPATCRRTWRPCRPPRRRRSRRARRPRRRSRARTRSRARCTAPEPDDGVLGVISIARPGRPFSERQRELFAYLANQAAISIENVDLHETIQRQAVTDELTGPLQPPPLPGGHDRGGRARPGASTRSSA